LAAASTAVFWIWLLVSIAEMVSVGLTAVAARRYGEGRADEAARTAGDALVLSLGLGVLCGAAGLAFLTDLFALMHTPPEVSALGVRYLGTYLVGAPLIFGFFAVDAAFRAAGDTRTSFVLLCASVALTLVLDPVLIVGWGPIPPLGVAGAAIATIGTRAVAFGLGLAIVGRRGVLRIGRVRWRRLLTIVRIGMPTAITGVVFSLIYVLLTRTATQFGTPALAALGIGHRVESWLFMIGVGFGAATAAIVGQNLGAGRTDRADRAGWIAVGFCSALGAAFCVVELLIPERIAAIFTHDPAVIAEGAKYLRIAAISQLGICAEIVLEGALGGAGYTLAPMLTSTVITASRIPLAAWAAAHYGSAGLWWTISLTALGRAAGMMTIWRSGRWKRSSIA
jgi:putative MATE family efflux protein